MNKFLGLFGLFALVLLMSCEVESTESVQEEHDVVSGNIKKTNSHGTSGNGEEDPDDKEGEDEQSINIPTALRTEASGGDGEEDPDEKDGDGD